MRLSKSSPRAVDRILQNCKLIDIGAPPCDFFVPLDCELMQAGCPNPFARLESAPEQSLDGTEKLAWSAGHLGIKRPLNGSSCFPQI